MENKKGFSVLKAVITVICILFIVVSLAMNIAFSKSKTPNIFGTYVYIVENNPLGSNVTDGAALLAKEVTTSTQLIKGDIVLCYPLSDPDTLQLRSIADIVKTDGVTKYATGIATGLEPDSAITRDKIVALCTGNPESLELGKFITFTTSVKGIVLELILPCIILVILLIAKIASSSEDDDEDYDFYEYDEDEEDAAKSKRAPSHEKSGNPLFEPSQEIQPSNDFERKKMSIAENFSQKHVNHNSPYQKEKERTMQFKAQRSAESSFAARNVGGQSSTAPTADALREEMLRKTAEAERTGSFSTKLYAQQEAASEPVTDNTGILSKSQLAEMARNDVPKTTPLKSPSASAAPKKKSSSPDIDDIITKSASNAKKKNVSSMSVDDLLKMIEDEKSKL
ncbi:MAG: hypothetical protein E7497_06210 [Ruminococcus sp.]|nr:hypothetical protein [Ruminococcus sp.]